MSFTSRPFSFARAKASRHTPAMEPQATMASGALGLPST